MLVCLGPLLVWVGIGKFGENVLLKVFHDTCFFFSSLVVITLQVQQTMDDQVRVVRFKRLALFGRFALNSRRR